MGTAFEFPFMSIEGYQCGVELGVLGKVGKNGLDGYVAIEECLQSYSSYSF